MRDVPHDREIMRDEEIGYSEIALQVLHKIDDLSPHRDVEGGDRLVSHNERGLQRQGPGDADPLALSAGKAVRIAVGGIAGQSHALQQFGNGGTRLLCGSGEAVDDKRFRYDARDLHARIERRIGILQDDLHARTQASQRLATEMGNVLAAEDNPALRSGNAAEHRTADGRLAGAGFAYKTKRFARCQVEAHIADGIDAPAFAEKSAGREFVIDGEAGNRKHGGDRHTASLHACSPALRQATVPAPTARRT